MLLRRQITWQSTPRCVFFASACVCWYLLLEVAPLLLVYEHQVEVVAHRVLLVDVLHGGGHLIAGQEQPDGDGLPCSSDNIDPNLSST